MTRMFAATVVTAFALIPWTADAQDVAEKGMQVFAAQKCNVCHSIAGKGMKKGPLDDVGSRLSAAEIRQWITDPVAMSEKRQPKSTRKPPMTKRVVAPEDVDALVAFLAGLKK